MSSLVLKRASASRSAGEWNDDDFDVLADGAVVGRIMKAAAAPVGAPWLWTILSYENRQPIGDARGRDGGVRQKLAAGVVLKSGGRSAFGGKPENVC